MKKSFYSLFLKIVIAIFLISIICCYATKVNLDVIGNICLTFIIVLLVGFIVNSFIIEPKQEFIQINNNIKKDTEIDVNLIQNIITDYKLKKWYLRRKLLSPIVVIPFSIILGIVIRHILETQLRNTYGYYKIQNIETFITIALIAFCIYSVYIYFRKTFQIEKYLEKVIFDYAKSTYQMTEIQSDDELVKNTMNTYINMINRKFSYQVNMVLKINSSEKRFFKLWVYYRGRPSTKAGAGSETIFNGVSMIIPMDFKSIDLFYKTNDYMLNKLAYDSFNNYTLANNISDELKEKMEEVHFKYNKPFRIVTIDDSVQIFCEQNLVTSSSFSKLQVYVIDYFRSIECILKLSEIIENYL